MGFLYLTFVRVKYCTSHIFTHFFQKVNAYYELKFTGM